MDPSSASSSSPSSSPPPRLLPLGAPQSSERSLELRPDLGLRRVAREWRALLLSPVGLKDDFIAGLTVACVAVPLSLAIALASGVAPAVGLVTAIVAGIVCAVFGGSRLQVSGPAAAMAVVVAAIVEEHGLGGLLVVGLACGVLQLLSGALGIGRYMRLVPLPVIEGFTAGIGAIILVGQLPRALGLPAPPESHVFDVVTHLRELAHQTHPAAVGITLLSLAIIYGLPRLTKRVPAHLAAVVISTILVFALGLHVETIGPIPRSIPSPHLPSIPDGATLGGLAGSALVVYALASLETLLSASAVDKLAKSTDTDYDQELVGQGFGNIASSMFGGIPISGVIARSSTNVLAGAKTRRAAVIHAILLLLGSLVFAPVMGRIPIPALAAVLFSVAFRMLSPANFRRLARHSPADGVVYALTFATIVFVGLLEGVRWGIVAALCVSALRLGRRHTVARGLRAGEQHVFTLSGPLTFLSSLDAERVGRELGTLEQGRTVVFDLRAVTVVDASGAELLASLAERATQRELQPFVLGLIGKPRDAYLAALAADIGKERAEATLVDDERTLADRSGAASNVDSRLIAGVERYRSTMRPRYHSLFEQLAHGQEPHTLFITCSDSRINPNLITSTDPGELFIVRDIGNLVPDASRLDASAIGAAVEYAVGILRVRKIIVCGHSGCGAMKAIVSGDPLPPRLSKLHAWLDATQVHDLVAKLPHSLDIDQVGRLNVLAQLDHLMSYEVVREKVGDEELSLGAWFFDVGSGDVEEWSDDAQRFVPLGEATEREPRARAPSERQQSGTNEIHADRDGARDLPRDRRR